MPKIIHLFNSSIDEFNQTAIALYDKAYTKAQAKKSKTKFANADDIAHELKQMLQGEFSHLNLLDKSVSEPIYLNIYNWAPPEADSKVMVKYAGIQDFLLNLFNKEKLAQQELHASLQSEGKDYQDYLAIKIKRQLKNVDADLYKVISRTNNSVEELFLSQNRDRLLQLKQKNKLFALTCDKYAAMKELNGILSYPEKIKDFKQSFYNHRKLLETRRDSGAITFLKVVASVFLSISIIGAFFVPKLWKIEGKKVAKKIHSQLPKK